MGRILYKHPMMFGYETVLSESELLRMNGLVLFCVVALATAACTYGKIFYFIFHIISVNNPGVFCFCLLYFAFFFSYDRNIRGLQLAVKCVSHIQIWQISWFLLWPYMHRIITIISNFIVKYHEINWIWLSTESKVLLPGAAHRLLWNVQNLSDVSYNLLLRTLPTCTEITDIQFNFY